MTQKHLKWKKKWRLWKLDALRRYYFELNENPTHPFEDLGDGFYYLPVRSDKFIFGVGLTVSTVTCFTLFCVFIGLFSFPLALFIVVVASGIFAMFGHFSVTELIISRRGGYCMRIKGTDKVLIEEPIHNCYIKLQRKFDARKQPHFYLILGGYRLDDIRISGMYDKDEALRILGTRLAEKMGINYFDYDNNSTLHKIIHYPSFSTVKATEEEYYKFLHEHYLSKLDIRQAMTVERLPHHTHMVPSLISQQIKSNYVIGARLGKGEAVKQSSKKPLHRSSLKLVRDRESIQKWDKK